MSHFFGLIHLVCLHEMQGKPINCCISPPRWRSRLERLPRVRKFRCSILSRDKPKSLKQVVTAKRSETCVCVKGLRIIDDRYKRMPRVTVCVARYRTLTTLWPWVPSIGQHLKSFTGNGDVSI